MSASEPVIGMIVSRNCPTCGHHEIGYIDRNNTFHPLRPGDMVQVLTGGMQPDVAAATGAIAPTDQHMPEDALAGLIAWAPDPITSDKALRLKYGVLVDCDMSGHDIPPGLYAVAFRQKLHRLLSEEKYTPLPVIFDRFFGVPQLATGNALQMVDALMEELDELKKPVRLVQDWLSKRDNAALAALIHPKGIQDLEESPVETEKFKKELAAQTLAEFFELL